MWQCSGCGCRGIAHDLMFCPLCLKERDMPAISRNGGATNNPEVTRQAPAESAQEPAPAVVLAEPEPAPESAQETAQAPAKASPAKATKSAK